MLRLDQVGVRYGDRNALTDISADLLQQRIGIIGANGSGKSTLARLLNGLVLPTAGRVTLHTEAGKALDTRRHGGAVRKHVGFVFTDPDAQIIMPTVAEDVAFSLRRAKLPRAEVAARVSAQLDRFGLAEHADHPAHLLSGGQKQLLALAAVLISEPQILVCDEPTTLLDLRNADMVSGVLASLPQQVILVTHDLNRVQGCDRVLVIDHGRIAADGLPADVVPVYRDLMRAPS